MKKIPKDSTVYYSHSKRTYDTKEEEKALAFLETISDKVINPKDYTFKTMEEYVELLKTSDVVVVTEFEGHIGKGVFEEIAAAKEHDIPFFVMKDLSGKMDGIKEVIRCRGKGTNWSTRYAQIVSQEDAPEEV